MSALTSPLHAPSIRRGLVLTVLVRILAVLLPVQAFATGPVESVDVDATCDAITIDLSGYDWTEGHDAVDERSHLEYRFEKTDTVTDVSEEDWTGYVADGYVETDATKHVTQPATDATTEKRTTSQDQPPSSDWSPDAPPSTMVSDSVVVTLHEWENKPGKGNTKWLPVGESPGGNGDQWSPTGATKEVEDQAAEYEYHWVRTVPGADEVSHYTYTMTKTVTTDWIREDQDDDYRQEPWSEINDQQVVDVAAVPAVTEVLNDLELTVDGDTVLTEQFEDALATSHTLPADTDAYDYEVRVNRHEVDSGSVDCTDNEETEPAEDDDGAVVGGKVKVCKYVGPPGDERLKGGKNPIEVSENSVPDEVDPIVVGSVWADAQHHSQVIPFDSDDCGGATPVYTVELTKAWERGTDPDQLFDDETATATLETVEAGPFEDGATVTVEETAASTGHDLCTVASTAGLGELAIVGADASDEGVISHTVTNTVDCKALPTGSVTIAKQWNHDEVAAEEGLSPDASFTVRIDGQEQAEPADIGEVYEDLPLGTIVEVTREEVTGLPDWCASTTDLSGAAWTLTESAPIGTITVTNDVTCEPLLDIEVEKQWLVDSDPDGVFAPGDASSTLALDPESGRDGDALTVAETGVDLGSQQANEQCTVIGKTGNDGIVDASLAVDGTYTHTHTSTVRCEPSYEVALVKEWVTLADLLGGDGPLVPEPVLFPSLLDSPFFDQLEQIAPLLSALVPTLDGPSELIGLLSAGFDPTQASATLEGASDSGRPLDRLLEGDQFTVDEIASSTGSDRCHVVWTDGLGGGDPQQPMPELLLRDRGLVVDPEQADEQGVITHTVTNVVACVPVLPEPTIEVDKEADAESVVVDGEETVGFTVTITNPGPYVLGGLVLEDTVAGQGMQDLSDLVDGALSDAGGELAPGETVTVAYDHAVTEGDAAESDELVNTASVTGEVLDSCWMPQIPRLPGQEDFALATVCDTIGVAASDTETVGLSVDEPTTPAERPVADIDLAKTASVDEVTIVGPDGTAEVDYEYVVTNSGERTLRDLELTDDVLGDLTAELMAEIDGPALAVGDEATVTVTQTVDADDVGELVNIATASARGGSRTVTDEATASVDVLYEQATTPTEEPDEPTEDPDPADPTETADPQQPDESPDLTGGDAGDPAGEPTEPQGGAIVSPTSGVQAPDASEDGGVRVTGAQVERVDGDRLPRTGTDLLMAALLAGLAIAGGMGLLTATRRRAAAHEG